MGLFDSFFNNRKKRENLRKLAELKRSQIPDLEKKFLEQ
tara:strand:- start:376 stop:492 length:117 start_codon:yes stop_codon:yes gene_type:complete